MGERSEDWLRQADRDLAHARHASEDQDFEWACFAAQQAAEKAVKGLYERKRMEGWGHTVSKLVRGLAPEVTIPGELVEAALRLDKHYVPTRYPNGFESGAPGDFYTKGEAEQAIEDSRAIIEYCRKAISGAG